ncbi:SGNH/GDSL hydrolase family protein [Amycolatopsis anabasis]|uniref:SGNH/GDSL hydrolase family protein n=1 Tax=Amycolatopsis anabasis TaxID=1840409 RepID=UPI00131C6F76|nr:SGNH/GDSL hydrolase family protein [Amycolatopsis anabasis]
MRFSLTALAGCVALVAALNSTPAEPKTGAPVPLRERTPCAHPDAFAMGQSGPWAPGIYVIGDSISLLVPYGPTNTAAGLHTWERVGIGWNVMCHSVPGGDTNDPAPGHDIGDDGDADSFGDAGRSPAQAVWIELGSNDIACIMPGCPGTPPDPVLVEFQRIFTEVDAEAQRLADRGKCVVWAGAREIDRRGTPPEVARAFNQHLRDLQNRWPGRFFYVDYHAYSYQNEALRRSLDDPIPGQNPPDGLHPRTAEGRQAIASLELWTSRAHCGI